MRAFHRLASLLRRHLLVISLADVAGSSPLVEVHSEGSVRVQSGPLLLPKAWLLPAGFRQKWSEGRQRLRFWGWARS